MARNVTFSVSDPDAKAISIRFDQEGGARVVRVKFEVTRSDGQVSEPEEVSRPLASLVQAGHLTTQERNAGLAFLAKIAAALATEAGLNT